MPLEQGVVTAHEIHNVPGDGEGPRRIVEVLGVATGAGPMAGLSPQQQRVLEQLALGMTNKQIAQVLGITSRTVNFHVSQAFHKLQVKGRLRAALAFLELQRTQGLPANDPPGVYPPLEAEQHEGEGGAKGAPL